MGIAFVSPFDAINRLVKIKKSAATPSLRIAIEEVWEHPKHEFKKYPSVKEGLLVSFIYKNGPAGKAGLKKSDVIIAVDGKKVKYRDELLSAVRKKNTGEKINIMVLRANKSKPIKISITPTILEKGWPGNK